MYLNISKTTRSRWAILVAFTCLVSFQTANAQANKTDKPSVQSAKSEQIVLPGERDPADVAIDQQMAKEGKIPTNVVTPAFEPQRDPADVAIDQQMAKEGKIPTNVVTPAFEPQRDPADMAIDQQMGTSETVTKANNSNANTSKVQKSEVVVKEVAPTVAKQNQVQTDKNLPIAATPQVVKVKTYQRDRSTDGIIYMDGSVRQAKKQATPTQKAQEITEGVDAPRAATPQVVKAKTYQRDRSTDGIIYMDGSVRQAKKQTTPTQKVQEITEGVDAPRAVTPQVVKAKTYQRDRTTSGVINMNVSTKKEKENQ